MIRIEHAALWTRDLERSRAFYERYFGASAGPLYENQGTRFASYFLRFGSGARLELMHRSDDEVGRAIQGPAPACGHLAFAVGSEDAVDDLTRRLRADGHAAVDGPRRTGDGYYESVVLDPDGHRIEITV